MITQALVMVRQVPAGTDKISIHAPEQGVFLSQLFHLIWSGE